jgi:tetratricopeptide (TPR) repeat protein
MNTKDHNSQDRPKGDFNPDLTPAEFEAEFWGRVLKIQPYYEDVLRRQAESLARAGRYDELLPLDRRIVALRPDDAVVHYHLACTLARLDYLEDSLAMLTKALHLGYDDYDHLESDPDLDPLRELPEFLALLRAAKNN